MTTYILLGGWGFASVIAFDTLRRLWLRDFGEVTVGDAIFFALISAAVPPSALFAALIIWLDAPKREWLGKSLWTREQ
jgi:hypothetical protein